MEAIRGVLAALEPWTHDAMKAAYEALVEQSGMGFGKFIHPTRLALTGKSVGPGLFELAELLGREACLRRVDKAIEYIQGMGE